MKISTPALLIGGLFAYWLLTQNKTGATTPKLPPIVKNPMDPKFPKLPAPMTSSGVAVVNGCVQL